MAERTNYLLYGKCDKCDESFEAPMPDGWAINYTGVLQVAHLKCGTVQNNTHLWPSELTKEERDKLLVEYGVAK